MENIEYYIEQSKSMENTSDGGSKAYHFDDVVLIKYVKKAEYGNARECEEDVAKAANEKNAQGVRTPKHLAIKRVTEGDYNICWVLQERAKGRNFEYYCRFHNNPNIQIERQKELLSAPDSHYDKLVSDMCELLNLGTEVKAKNVFYDDNHENGGFTIIDLLGGSNEPFNPDSIENLLKIWMYLNDIVSQTTVSPFEKDTDSKKKSVELSMHMRQRIFTSMERVIPNFGEHRREVLRTLNKETRDFFEKNGTEVGDLTLDDKEEIIFEQRNLEIIKEVIEGLEDEEFSKHRYTNALATIGRKLKEKGQEQAWLYHRNNDKKDSSEESRKDLVDTLHELFDEKLRELAKTTSNQSIQETVIEMEEYYARVAEWKRIVAENEARNKAKMDGCITPGDASKPEVQAAICRFETEVGLDRTDNDSHEELSGE